MKNKLLFLFLFNKCDKIERDNRKINITYPITDIVLS